MFFVYKHINDELIFFLNLRKYRQLTRFPIEMRFLYHKTPFLICGNKRTKDRKTSHIIKCVMIFIFFMLKKLRYIEC